MLFHILGFGTVLPPPIPPGADSNTVWQQFRLDMEHRVDNISHKYEPNFTLAVA